VNLSHIPKFEILECDKAHPRIHLVTLLADLSDKESQKSYRDKSQCKPREQVVNYQRLGSNKALPCDHHKQPLGSG
jgi:hypothetical protein